MREAVNIAGDEEEERKTEKPLAALYGAVINSPPRCSNSSIYGILL